jgi:hypothetical protein
LYLFTGCASGEHLRKIWPSVMHYLADGYFLFYPDMLRV